MKIFKNKQQKPSIKEKLNAEQLKTIVGGPLVKNRSGAGGTGSSN